MAKTHTRYVCQECGRVSASYMGKCPQCGSFNSMIEEVVHDEPVSKVHPPSAVSPGAHNRVRSVT